MTKVKIKRVLSWTIPYFGNDHIMPYGTLLVTDGQTEKACRTKGDRYYDNEGYQYVTFKRRRYEVVSSGNPASGMRITLRSVE